MLATVYNNIGGIYYARGDYDAALRWLEKAAPVLAEIGNRAMLATVEANLAVLFLQQGNESQAEIHLRRSVALFDELGLETDEARITREVLRLGRETGWEIIRALLDKLTDFHAEEQQTI